MTIRFEKVPRKFLPRPVLALSLTLFVFHLTAIAQTAMVEFSATGWSFSETNSAASITVRRTGNTNAAVSVNYTVTNGTAVAGFDYIATNGTVTFAAGETNRAITIPILDDGLVEGGETVLLSLSNPTGGATLGPQNAAVLTIEDNETPTVLDLAFDPGAGADRDVFSIALQPDGGILIGGQFNAFDNTPRNRIARLNADGSLDAAFDPGSGADEDIYAVALQADGKVLIGGGFMGVNGVANRYVARLQTNGAVDTTFNSGANVNNELRAIVVQPDGKILIAGRFTEVAGQSRNRIARLNEDGTLDTTFSPGTGANNNIRSMMLQADGRILIGGQFTTFNATNRSRIARLLSDGALDPGFDPGTGADDQVRAIAMQTNGMTYIGGDFEIYNGTNRSAVARLFANGGLDLSFDQGDPENDAVRALTLDADGKVWVGGIFAEAGGVARRNIARLNADGTADTAFDPLPGADDEVFTTVLQPNGLILLGGKFNTVHDVARRRVARLVDGNARNSFEFTAARFYGNEVTAHAVITIRRSGESSNSVSVVFTTSDGTATGGVDYEAQNRTLTFGPLETLKSFLLPIYSDGIAEGIEIVNLELRGASAAAALLEISDDGGRIGFSVDAITVGEADGVVGLIVTRAGSLGGDIRVNYRMDDGTARAGLDYLGTTGTVTFPSGVGSVSLPVLILNDGLKETNETFTVTLLHPAGGAVLGETTIIVVTINDNEFGLGFPYHGQYTGEGYNAEFATVVKNWDTTNIVTVQYTTRDATATAGIDYEPQTGTLTFAPDEYSKTIRISLLNDGLAEGTEIFEIVLTNVTGGPLLAIDTFPIIIVDNDSGIEFNRPIYGVSETNLSVVLSVRRGDDVTNTVTVDYRTQDGTAKAGLDYAMQAGTLTLPPGETNVLIAIPVYPDGSSLVGKKFSVHLTNASLGVNLGLQPSAVVHLIDPAQPGALDFSFNPDPSLPAVSAVAVQPDGKAVVGLESLPVFDGSPVARLNLDGSLDSEFHAESPPLDWVFWANTYEVVVQPDGRILLGGRGYVPWGDDPRPTAFYRRLEPSGAFRDALEAYRFGFVPDPGVRSIHWQPDGRILLGGDFAFSGLEGRNFVRLNPDGLLDSTLQPPPVIEGGAVLALASQPDGKVLLGGSFTNINGTNRTSLARLNADGSLDASFFNPDPTNACDGQVRALTWLPDGKILVAGSFSRIQGGARMNLARLNSDGTLDPAFPARSGPDSNVVAMAAQPDGRIVIAGDFTTVGGLSRPSVARLSADGSLDESFDTGAGPDGPVRDLAVLPDGDVVIVGAFDSVNGVPRPHIARLKGYSLRLDRPAHLGNGHVQLRLRGQPGTKTVIEASTNLNTWLAVSTNTLPTGDSVFIDTNTPAFRQRFYRAVTSAP